MCNFVINENGFGENKKKEGHLTTTWSKNVDLRQLLFLASMHPPFNHFILDRLLVPDISGF